MKRLSIIGVTCILIQVPLAGQTIFPEVFSSFGGNAKNSNVDITFTMGEPLYETITNTSSVLTQGFNQISKATDVNVLAISDILVIAYPNPTTNILNLQFQFDKFSDLDLLLMDVQGRVLLSKSVKKPQEALPMAGFASGIYFLKLINKGKLVKIIKVQKINEI